MKILRSIDIEFEVKKALKNYFSVYLRPLPKNYLLPHIEVTAVGGTAENTINTFEVTLDARAKNEAEASECLRNAIGALKAIAASNTTAIRHIEENASGSWGSDPVRPDLAMCTARLRITAHKEVVEIKAK